MSGSGLPPSDGSAASTPAAAPGAAPGPVTGGVDAPGTSVTPDPAPPTRLATVRHIRPRRRWAQWPLTVVLAGIALSLLVVATDHFRRGSVLLSASVLLAFFLRLLLPERDAGMLVVRSKPVDLTVLGTLGLLLTLFTFWVPPPSS